MQHQNSNCPNGPAFGPPADSVHSAVISPPLSCDRRYRYRSHTTGSPFLDHPTAACTGPGTNDTDHLCGAFVVRTRMGPLARSPHRVRHAISRNLPDEKRHEIGPTPVLPWSGRCTPVLPDSRTESFRRSQ